MNKIIFVLAMMIANFAIEAQVKTPQASPKSTITQLVGLTNVEIVYSRPSAKGRDVFNNLVPFGKLWRTGANENTTITFSDDVVIDGKTLPKGKYALYTTPRADNWEVVFYSNTNNWGNPETWDETKVALKTNAKPEMLGRNVESFTIGINNLDNNYAHLEISWEKTLVAIKFEVPTEKIATASIEKALAGPTAGDYYASAQYLFQSNGDIAKALTYIDKALDMSKDKPFYYFRLKSLIQAKKGDKKGAIETAKISLVAAEAAKNQDYVKMNKDSIEEWSK
ncbi:MAG: dihydrolipoamide dehydrogenase [Flavobacterium sp.]|nr:dihydrolipoamide dehydrogenase [Flavobacterium sp.]